MVLNIRRTAEHDLPFIYAWYTDPAIAQQALCVVPDDYDEFAKQYTDLIKSSSALCFITLAGDERIGLAEIRCIGCYSGIYQGEAVLWLGQRRGSGLGLRLIVWLLQQAFEILNLDRLWWWVGRNNTDMLKICAKLDFRRLAEDETYAKDRIFFQMDRAEYESFPERNPKLWFRLQKLDKGR